MSREIKFREWHNNHMRTWEAINSLHMRVLNDGKGLFEQYTELFDMNGTEIYEGDIVRMHVIILSPDDKIGVVKYSPKYGYSIYFTSGRMARQEYWAANDKHTIEVIGNVHENPELLEEK